MQADSLPSEALVCRKAADFLGFQVKLSLRYPSAATLCFFPFPSNWKALGSFLSWSFAHELSSLSGSLLPHLCSAMHPLLCSRSHVQLQGLSCSNWSNLDVKLEEGGLTESPEDTLFPGSSWQELPADSWQCVTLRSWQKSSLEETHCIEGHSIF